MVKASSILVAGLLLAACTTSRTEVMLVVDTDMRGVGGLDTIRVEVISPDGATTTSTATLGVGQPPLPRTLGLVHAEGPLGPFSVRVVGSTATIERVSRVARFTFQEDRTLTLRIDLLAACTSVSCGTGQTCAAGACRSVDISPGELTEWTGTPPPLVLDGAVPDAGDRDLGTRDAGDVDAALPVDLGEVDAGVDAGPADLGVDLCSPTTEICNGADDDCNGTIDDGFDLQNDLLNCGSCGNACDFRNSTGACTLGVCTIAACNAGFTDCNSNGVDGCEVDLVTDRLNCGTCGMACVGGRNCCASMCSRTCP